MNRTITKTLLTGSIALTVLLAAPFSSRGSIQGIDPGVAVIEEYRLDLDCQEYPVVDEGRTGTTGIPTGRSMVLSASVLEGETRSLLVDPVPAVRETWRDRVHEKSRDMVSMVSYLWSELFTGVDMVAEVRIFAREISGKVPRVTDAGAGRPRLSWKFRFAVKAADDVELTARVKGSGEFMKGARYDFGLNASSVLSDEVGVRATYRGGDLTLKLADVDLPNEMAASVTLGF